MNIPPPTPNDTAGRSGSLHRCGGSFAPLQKSFDRIARTAARQFETPVALVSVVDDGRHRLVAKWGHETAETDCCEPFCARTMQQNDVLVVPDALDDPWFQKNSYTNDNPGFRFYAGAPLRTAGGRKVGTLCLMDTKPRPPLTDAQKALFSDLAAILADELERCADCTVRTDAISEAQGRAAAEKRLTSIRQQLCLLFEYAPVAIAMFNREMEYLAASRKWCDIFKIGDREIFGRSHYELVPGLPERWKADYERCLRGEALKWDEEYFQRADGTADWLRREMHPWFDANGDVGGIIVFKEIVTEKIQAAHELERNQRFLSAVLESIQEGIVACDARGRLNVFNSAAKRMLKADLAAIPPDRWAEYYNIYEADGKTLLDTDRLPLIRALRGEIVEDEELVLAPEDESPRRIICNARALIIRSGAKIGAVVSMQDVTEKKEIEAQYRQAQKMEAVGQLTGGLAHDFNNLLAVILGNLQLLQRRLKDDEESERRVAPALVAAQRGAELTNRLLSFARKQPLATKPINVNRLIAGLKDLLARTLGEAIALKTVLENPVWTIRTDEVQLEAAILNLAINARDAMEEGGGLTIETRNISLGENYASHRADLTPGDYVMISVSDKGRGMPAGVQSKAFEPFFTTKDVGKGSGLGLSMVYGFIKQSAGHIEIRSREGYGTTVELYFPRSFEDAERSDGLRLQDFETGAGSERILIVEDNAAVRDVAVALLEDLGYRTAQAANGQAALDILKSSAETFDLLLTDVVMPGKLNGPALAKAAKETSPNIKVLFTSGYAHSTVLRDGDIGSDADLVSKPFQQEALARKVRQVLQRG